MSDTPRAKDLFLDALDQPPAERKAWVERACADMVIRQAVMDLLAAHGEAPTLSPPVLTQIVPSSGGAATSVAFESIGDVIDRYQLVRQLGEGGFGVVFLAKQLHPVVRDVALKLLKAGMDSTQIAQRFDAERQTVARMDHPQIARVFDAGTSERGRPYFVMEYVDGPPITTYCDEHRLSLAERLELFEQVCLAVQHAHTKGVIHRDLKPGNVLVSIVDGKPVPKIIDFGIAKAIDLHDTLALAPAITLEAQIIGTPQYMAPEQATIGPKNVDTRSDVYSLGAVLYELITGEPVFDRDALRKAGLERLCQIVKEQVPTRPSTRLSSPRGDSAGAATTPTHRDSPARLRKQVAGEIDWIVMKALEKEPARRYQSAAEFAADIRRFLSHQPVHAGPPSWLYQARKFTRRHRLEVASATLVAVMLFGVAVFSTIKERQAREAAELATRNEARANANAELAKANELRANQKADDAARELSRANAIAELAETMLAGIGPSVAKGRDTAILKDMLDRAIEGNPSRFEGFPDLDILVRKMIGKAQFDLGDYQKGIDTLLPRFVAMRDTPHRDNVDRLHAGVLIGSLLTQLGRSEEAMPILQECIDGYARIRDETSIDSLEAKVALATAMQHKRRYAEALPRLEAVLETLQRTGRGEHELALLVANTIGTILLDTDRFAEALSHFEKLLEIEQRVLGEDDPGTLACLSNIAFLHESMGNYDKAVDYGKTILARYRRIYEPTHPYLFVALNNLGAAMVKVNQLDEAERCLLEARAVMNANPQSTRRYESPFQVQMMNLRAAQGRKSEAVEIARALRDRAATEHGENHSRTRAAETLLLGMLIDAGEPAAALERLETHNRAPLPADMSAAQISAYHTARAQVYLLNGRQEDARSAASLARAALAGSSFESNRLRAVERDLTKAATQSSTTRPVAGSTAQPATEPASHPTSR